MKNQKRNPQGLYFKTKTNRWKWMAGATAASAAGVTASQAGLVTISLTNNFIDATGGNHLNADLTGDAHPDLTIANAFNFSSTWLTTSGHPLSGYKVFTASVKLNGILAHAYRHDSGGPHSGTERLGSRAAAFNSSSGTASLTGSIPIFFKDLHINGGAPTSGLLQVTVSASNGAEIQLDSFTYTSNTSVEASSRAVPEHGSTLALLAMGGGGILALRRLRATQRRS